MPHKACKHMYTDVHTYTYKYIASLGYTVTVDLGGAAS